MIILQKWSGTALHRVKAIIAFRIVDAKKIKLYLATKLRLAHVQSTLYL